MNMIESQLSNIKCIQSVELSIFVLSTTSQYLSAYLLGKVIITEPTFGTICSRLWRPELNMKSEHKDWCLRNIFLLTFVFAMDKRGRQKGFAPLE